MAKIRLGSAVTAALLGCACVSSTQIETMQMRYTNARVFDGNAFVRRDVCVTATRIVACAPRPGRIIDLEGAFITPPFGDAHTHHFDSEFTLDWHSQIALESGAFYAMNLTAISTQVEAIRDRLGGPGRVDVISSTGGITGPESHPAEIYEAIAIGAYSYEDQLARADEIRASRKVADNAYYVVEDATDVDDKWPLLMSRNPDLIKVFLRTSERYDEGFGKWGPGGGIDPDLLPAIREKANTAGLRLAVATSTRSDFEVAVRSGADIVTHPPCYQDSSADPDSPYYDVDTEDQCLIDPETAAVAATNGLTVVLITSEWAKERPSHTVAWEQQNIRVLDAAGVGFAVGSNAYGSTMTEGLVFAVEKDFLPASDLLRIATRDSPRLILPDRQVGCLEAGCEASFIGFGSNPLHDAGALRDIVFRLKDGQPVTLEAGGKTSPDSG
jgi:imidazolonepropionase-like amidohydrolase